MKIRKAELSRIFLIAMVVFFILAIIFLAKGHNKITKYYTSELFPSNNVNAYVGGDAYNYIINGNYATGYFVLAMGFFVSGVICASVGAGFSLIPETAPTAISFAKNESSDSE